MYTRPFRARKRAHSERAHRETQHHLTVIEDPEAIVGRPPSEAAWSAEDFAVARRGHLAASARIAPPQQLYMMKVVPTMNCSGCTLDAPTKAKPVCDTSRASVTDR